MNKFLIAFILEGISIGFFVSSATTLSTILTSELEDEKTKVWISWIVNLIISAVAHVIASSFRHDRVLGMLNSVTHRSPRKSI